MYKEDQADEHYSQADGFTSPGCREWTMHFVSCQRYQINLLICESIVYS